MQNFHLPQPSCEKKMVPHIPLQLRPGEIEQENNRWQEGGTNFQRIHGKVWEKRLGMGRGNEM